MGKFRVYSSAREFVPISNPISQAAHFASGVNHSSANQKSSSSSLNPPLSSILVRSQPKFTGDAWVSLKK